MLPKRTVFAAAAVAAVGIFISLPVTGNDPNALASGNEYLAFRLPLWKTSHFDDAAQAEKQIARLAKFGCETKQDQNNVSYRCTNWCSIQGESPRQSQRWGQWLTTLGFEISHVEIDEAFTRGNEVIEFRMPDWKSIQSDRSRQQQQFVDYLRRLGVEVEVQKHQHHSEIRYRAPTWRNLRFGNQDSADQTRAWLKQQGFEARYRY
ncbi:hypothetical protein K227x_28400 [Rubripirellula lacrimiformis]|uniref:SPOR domain-containing protein n=2 Tax=Rubripirellula lacrimiformis TaxID=1930273 RepID=A0A517NBD5_9BACT|nr:hypothetical protein K227x_28400 [Rubripirellula lacrimiformis]